MKKMIVGLLALLSLSQIAAAQTATVDYGRSGPQAVSDGQTIPQRLDKSAATVVTDGHGRFQEPTYRGNVFRQTKAAYTIVAANASAGALGTIKFANGFYNPLSSGKAAVILDAHQATTSGTPGGPLIWNYYCGLNITSAATGSILSGVVSNSAGASAMVPQTDVVIAATPAATPNALVFGVLGGPAAVAAGVYSGTQDLVDGKIIVPPGCVFGIAATATGSTHIVSTDISWEEISYP